MMVLYNGEPCSHCLWFLNKDEAADGQNVLSEHLMEMKCAVVAGEKTKRYPICS